VHENRRFRGLVRRASRKHNIDKVAADPAYDDYKNYELPHKKKIRAAIKPRNNANPDYQQARYKQENVSKMETYPVIQEIQIQNMGKEDRI